MALTADEEGGGPYNGVEWLLKNHRNLIDAEFSLNEGGWGEMQGETRLSNNIQVSEKYVVNYRFEVRNQGGHSSLPVATSVVSSSGRAMRSSRSTASSEPTTVALPPRRASTCRVRS